LVERGRLHRAGAARARGWRGGGGDALAAALLSPRGRGARLGACSRAYAQVGPGASRISRGVKAVWRWAAVGEESGGERGLGGETRRGVRTLARGLMLDHRASGRRGPAPRPHGHPVMQVC
jgi:hypothetical protein